MSPTPVMFNGKFLSASPTGVHRVAGELIGHLDRLLDTQRRDETRSWGLACPRDAKMPLNLREIRRETAGVLTWQAWEQFELPGAAKGAVLVNLCNLAPLGHPRSVTMIHDAQVYLSPESYSKAFLAWYRFALPRIGAKAAKILTVSNYSRDRLVEYGVAPREKIEVVYNGVDHLDDVVAEPTIVSRLGLSPGRYVVAAGNAQKHKNIAMLFKMFAGGAMGDLSLVLAGADGREAFVASGVSPPDRVVFAGRVNDGALRALYEQAACLAFPSTTEGFGLPPLEAMRLLCPAVVTPCGALPEICGDAALYAAPDDPGAWAAAIRRAADDVETRTALLRAGVERADRYRWSASARKLLDILDDIR